MSHIYGLDESAQKLAAEAAKIAKEVAAPHAAEVDEKARPPKESLAALAKAGFYGLCVPTNLGGKGQGPRTFAAVVEELSQACGSTAMIYLMHVTAAQAIAASPIFPGKDALLKEIAAGKHLTTLALSEKGSRSNFWAPVSQLKRDGNGWHTTAEKSWVTAASEADSYVASAQMPDAKSPVETTCYLVRKGAKGVHVKGTFTGMGLRGNDSAPVTIEGLEVTPADLLSDHGAGIKTKLEVVLPWFSIGTAAMSNGLCRAAIAATSAHLSGTHFKVGADQALRDLQNLRFRIADMSLRTEQSRALLGYTLGLLEKPSEITPLYVLHTRAAAIETATYVTDLAMKACGGAAYSKHLSVDRIFRDAQAGWVMAPTSDHLHDFIGKALTGLPLM